MKRLVFDQGDLPVLVVVRNGEHRRFYVLTAAGRAECGASLQGLPEALVRELYRKESQTAESE